MCPNLRSCRGMSDEGKMESSVLNRIPRTPLTKNKKKS